MNDARDRVVQFVGRTWDTILTNAQRGLDQVKSPLYRNAFYIMLTSLVGNGLGLFFWVVAYRFYKTSDAGYAIAMVNTLTFLAGVTSLGLPIALIRFLPETDDPPALINTSLTIAAVLSAIAGLVFALGLRTWASTLVVVFGRPEYIPIIVLTAVAYALGPILDNTAIAARRADLYFWRVMIFALTKIPLPVVFALWFGNVLGGTLGIYMSWSIAFGVSVLVAGFVFLRKVIPGYRPSPRFSRRRLRPMVKFSLGNWVATVIGSAGSLLLPIIIISTLRSLPAESTAVFYAAGVVAGILYVIPAATMTSLYAEASQRGAERRSDERRAILLSIALLAPSIILMWIFANRLLNLLFDLDGYADLGTLPLRILSLSSIPIFLNSVYGTRVRVRKEIVPLIVSAAIVSFVTLPFGYLFLVWYGLPGLAAAVVLGQAMTTPYLYFVAGKPMEPEPIEPVPSPP
ncbi:MAG TPA: hypothetical protein VJP06_00295 [Thermoplasmata archaeon]|nr:hypothetical protein [Thermoplasmata archaeon]